MPKRNHEEDEESAQKSANALAPLSGPTELNRFIESMFSGFDTALGQFFPSFRTLSEWAPSVDLIDHGSHYTLTAELPGFSKDEVDVKVDEHTLEIKAERNAEKESKNKGYVQREQSRSVFHRAISIPQGIASSKVSGTMKNGVLELKLPKKEPSSESTRRVPLA